ncbi:MAG: hypothetical protein V7752_08985 [Halopseudomonas sp.]
MSSLLRRSLQAWLCLLWLWALPVQADSRLSELVTQLKQGQVSDAALYGKGMQSADGLFLLGWLYQQGRYGVAKDPQRGRELIQQAAEKGQYDAMHYCWSHCLELTPQVLEQLRQGVERNQLQAVYLQSQLLGNDGLQSADQLLLKAARQGHREAIGRLYANHFVDWAKQKRTLAEAEAKLQRCVDEGVTACYYLLGALYERHNNHQQALFYYQLLELVDPPLFQSYVEADHIAELLEYRPLPTLSVMRSRVASYLSQRSASGNDLIDRFQQCGADYPCIRRLSVADQQCLLSYFEASHLRDLRDSDGYRSCQALSAAL